MAQVQTEIAEAQHRRELLASGVLFAWDASRQRYIDLRTGRVISSARVRAWVDVALTNTERHLQSVTQRLINGEINLPAWATTVQRELKVMHTGLSEIAIGGKAEWSLSQSGRLGARLRMLYEKLNGLALGWEQGLVSPAQMLARTDMAVQAGRGTYEGMFRGMMRDSGMTEEMRTLGATVHCSDCPPLAGHWEPIGTLPGIGDTQCLSRCSCSFDYRSGANTSFVWG